MTSRINTVFMRRRNKEEDEDELILPMTDDGKKSNENVTSGYKRAYLSKCMLASGLLALLIMHRKIRMVPLCLRAMYRMNLHPNWRDWYFDEFATEFDCINHQRTVPTISFWQTLRNLYNFEIDSSHTFDDPIPPTQGYTLNENGAPPYYAKLSPGKGRGLFASRDITKGELVDGVDGGTKSDLKFPNVEAVRRYLLALPAPMVCDVIDWVYTAQLEKGKEPALMFASDISSLMNSAVEDNETSNVMPKIGSSPALLYAARDIKKGEEIMMDYNVFPEDGLWR